MLSTDTTTPPEQLTLSPSPLARLMRALAPEVDRRRKPRVAIPHLISLTPLEESGRNQPGPPAGPKLTVVGKDLSESGIGFYHEAALPYRFVQLTVDAPTLGAFEMIVQLSHCRFTKLGWYESGGRIVQVLTE